MCLSVSPQSRTINLRSSFFILVFHATLLLPGTFLSLAFSPEIWEKWTPIFCVLCALALCLVLVPGCWVGRLVHPNTWPWTRRGFMARTISLHHTWPLIYFLDSYYSKIEESDSLNIYKTNNYRNESWSPASHNTGGCSCCHIVRMQTDSIAYRLLTIAT